MDGNNVTEIIVIRHSVWSALVYYVIEMHLAIGVVYFAELTYNKIAMVNAATMLSSVTITDPIQKKNVFRFHFLCQASFSLSNCWKYFK